MRDISSAMSDLASAARASRDATFNTVDAVQRQTRAAVDRIGENARKALTDALAKKAHDRAASGQGSPGSPGSTGVVGDVDDDTAAAPAPPAPPAERDRRFDPEDEWDVAPAAAPTPRPAPAPPRRRPRDDEDDDDYPDTWLR